MMEARRESKPLKLVLSEYSEAELVDCTEIESGRGCWASGVLGGGGCAAGVADALWWWFWCVCKQYSGNFSTHSTLPGTTATNAATPPSGSPLASVPLVILVLS